MPSVQANGIKIEYDTFGDESSPPLLLLMGLGAQMIWWDEEFCKEMADRGLYVIRMDNRDVGLSAKVEEDHQIRIMDAYAALARGERFSPPYTLKDMAGDAVGLLDALGLEKVHVCGSSMGGMIAQRMAIHFPERVLSLISIMSHTGNPDLPGPTETAQKTLTSPPPLDRAGYIEFGLKTWRLLGSPGFPFDMGRIMNKVAASYDRCFHPQGFRRQFLAILADGDRRPALKALHLPALVIHGADDPLVPLAGGRDTAEAIPGAGLMVVEGMGHDLPEDAWPDVTEAIFSHVMEAGTA